MTQNDFQQIVGEWGESTFPDSTLRSIMAHLREEIAELHDAVERQAFHDDIEERTTGAYRHEIAEEAADVYLLVLHLAYRCGIDLQNAAVEKFAENRLRTWHDDGRGYARHVEVQR